MHRTLAGPLLALVFAAVAFALFSQQRGFAFFYHSDESAKVEQVQTRAYNFHHPMLLLTATEWLLGDAKHGAPAQRVVEAGRLVSALFAALAVGALAWLAMLRGGWFAALATGGLLAMHQQLLELAHYMKEDPALLFGIALTFLALALYQQRPVWWLALAGGAACGVAVAGKYLGAVALACALPVVLGARSLTRRQRAMHGGFLLAGATAVFALVNLPLLRDLAGFRSSFDREVGFVVEGSKGVSRSVPHAIYLNIFADNTTPAIWLLLGVHYLQMWRRRREQDVIEWVIALFPLVLMAGFSFSPKTNDRYFLPLTATFYYLAALGLRDLAAWRPPLAGIALVAALALEAPKSLAVWRAFRHDDRRELAEFIRDHVPADAKIVQDERVMLPSPRNRKRGRVILDLPQTIVAGDRYAADFGDLDALRAEGFTHVAVTESNYGRFFLASLVPKDGQRAEHERHRSFYERLFREGSLLFELPKGTVIYLHPGLRLYRLPQ
jgi:hypothetical protein